MTVTPGIRTLIVDDEPLSRERIRQMLKRDADIEIVGDCGTGREAVTAIRERSPDLLFLDVQMPEMDGFAVLKALGRDRLPVVVFVTAYDRYAVKAFEVHALDYVLKPFKRKRFEEVLQRAKAEIRRGRAGDLSERTLALLERLQVKAQPLERLAVKTKGRVSFLRTAEIDWIEAEDNYVRLHVGKESHLLRYAMARLEAQLDPNKFLRIHRSAIVNIDRVRELRPWFNRDYQVILHDGTQLMLSRSYREKLNHLLTGC